MTMTLPPFQYAAPATLGEALDLLREHAPDARLLAGGTDLLVAMRERGLRTGWLIDLKRIPGLTGISVEASGHLRIGALTPVRDVERSPLARDGWPVLARSAGMLASIQIRNRATIGGNLCNASPAADLAPPLMVLGAQAIAMGADGERTFPLAELFAGPGRTTLAGEVLVSILVPPMPAGARASYQKHGPRGAMDIAIADVAVLGVAEPAAATAETDPRRWAEVRIALGAVAPTPIRAIEAEAVLAGAPVSTETMGEAARLAAAQATPISDVRGSAEYRTAMIAALTRRALEEVSA
jgi:carbon-monoxide dehydrogenase medium subunit